MGEVFLCFRYHGLLPACFVNLIGKTVLIIIAKNKSHFAYFLLSLLRLKLTTKN